MIRAGVVGWPIEHSRSPLIHGYWLRKYGIAGSYERIAVEPAQAASFFASLGQRGLAGCNVTVPLKEIAFAAALVKEPSALAVGAANTLWLEGGRLHAANTDTYGFMKHLEMSAPAWRDGGRHVVVLGAGGAARAIVHGFLAAGIGEVRIANRTRERAEAIAVHFGKSVAARDWSERSEVCAGAAVVVNTTSIGMKGEGSLGLDVGAFSDGTVVADIVYVPLETELLAAARRRGLVAVDGLGMLLHQAVPGFERWFGIRPEVTADLRRIVVADIEGR